MMYACGPVAILQFRPSDPIDGILIVVLSPVRDETDERCAEPYYNGRKNQKLSLAGI